MRSSATVSVCFVCFVCFVVNSLAAEQTTAEPQRDRQAAASLQRKQEVQKRIGRMARQLVASVIDIQLRQLEENGLQSHEWYRDIRAMRGHIDELVDAEMQEVVELLTQIDTVAPAEREAKILQARQKSREVLIRLLVERQNLLRRLRISEMAAEVRRLIAMETKVQTTTRSLPSQTQARRESLALTTVEDQRDVKEIYLRLKVLLSEVANWGGTVGAQASHGLELLKQHRVDEEMDSAGQHLVAARFSEAEASQEKVIDGLRTLLDVIERARGLINKSDRQAVQEAIRELADKQEQVRQATTQAELNNPESPESKELVQKQQEIAKELAKMAEEKPPQSPLMQAENAAQKAAEQMFAGKQEDALAEQQKVMDNLAKAAKQAERTETAESRAMAEAQAQQSAADLEAAKKDLEKILKEQQATAETAKTDPKEAQKQENQIARELGDVPAKRRLADPLAPRVKEAQQAAAAAATAMKQPAEQRQAAAEKAEQAIQRALSEVETALADAQRRDMALKIEELAKAAEAADREATKPSGLQTEKAKELRKEMAKTAEQLAALTDKQLKQAHEALKSVEQAAANQPAEATAAKIERLAQAEQAVRQAAADQQRAAGRPEAAKAMDLKAGIEKAIEMQKQADRAAEAAAHRQTPSPLHAVEQQREVAQAAEKLAQQAAGRESQDQPQGQDQSADKAASKPEQASTPTKDADKSQAAPPGAAKPNPVADALKRAQQAAEKAAKEMLAAPEQGQAARADAKQALEEAKKLAAAEMKRAMESPAGKPDMAAQERVGREIKQARELARADAPPAAETLGQAEKTSAEAQGQAAEGKAAAKSQEATAQSLDKAAQQLAEAKQQMAREAAPQFAAEAKEADRVTNQAIPVAAGATAALQSAENQAGQAAKEVPQMPSQAKPAEEGVQQSLDAAAAEIAAREQQLARHEALAKEITGLAGQQQQTAERMAALARDMAQQPPAAAVKPPAKAMAEAAEQLSQATQATIEAAREIAGQGTSNRVLEQAKRLAAKKPQEPRAAGGLSPGGGSKAPWQRGAKNEPKDMATVPEKEMPNRDLRTPDSAEQVAEKGDRKQAEEPWMVNLPPELRQAIRANSQQRPPRGYEERLQRYFKSVD